MEPDFYALMDAMSRFVKAMESLMSNKTPKKIRKARYSNKKSHAKLLRMQKRQAQRKEIGL